SSHIPFCWSRCTGSASRSRRYAGYGSARLATGSNESSAVLMPRSSLCISKRRSTTSSVPSFPRSVPSAEAVELVGHPRELLGHLPEAAGDFGVVRLARRLRPLRIAALLHEATGPEELAAFDVGRGGRVQSGQGAHGRRLGHE